MRSPHLGLHPRRAPVAFLAAAAVGIFLGEGCGTNGAGGGFDDGDGGAIVGTFGDDSAGPRDGGCIPPDMLIVLDHTLSMGVMPTGMRVPNTPAGHAQTKWVLATDAVKLASKPPNDQGVRFGLELFPLDPQTVDAGPSRGDCVTLTQLLDGTTAKNTTCQPGEVVVPPALGNGGTIGTWLDPETVRLCVSTPIASALDTAATELKSVADGSRKQFVLLVTDGGETCKGDSVSVVQGLASSGVQTFVVGFGSVNGGSAGVNVPLLNELACAGMTAQNFQTACTKSTGGYVPASSNGSPLFFSAQDGASLSSALQSIAGSVCCPCAQ